MTEWTAKVEAPFRDDRQFWASVGRSADAFWTLVISAVLVAVLGRYAIAAFCVPIVLLALSARHARASTEHTRPLFTSREQWRAAERNAVAAAIPGALVRRLKPGHRR